MVSGKRRLRVASLLRFWLPPLALFSERRAGREKTKTWITKDPAKNLELTMSLTDKSLYDKLEFSVDQSHRRDLKLSDSSAAKSSMSYEWIINSPILPKQGIIIHWRPKLHVAGERNQELAPHSEEIKPTQPTETDVSTRHEPHR